MPEFAWPRSAKSRELSIIPEVQTLGTPRGTGTSKDEIFFLVSTVRAPQRRLLVGGIVVRFAML